MEIYFNSQTGEMFFIQKSRRGKRAAAYRMDDDFEFYQSIVSVSYIKKTDRFELLAEVSDV